MTLAKALRWTLLALGGLVGCAVIGIAVHFWRNARPSDAARQLLAIHAARASAPDAENAFSYLWGLGAPAEVDPLDLGRRRVAWLRVHLADPDTSATDPGGAQKHAEELRSPELQALEAACNANGSAAPCTRAFDGLVANRVPTATEQRLLLRYEALVEYPRFFESVPFDADVALAPFDYASDGQRLLHVELARLAQSGDAPAVAAGLERDCAFWRTLQRDADTLIPKMMAIAALRRHFFFGNRILRRLPADAVAQAIPPCWRREFDAAERSMARVLAGEFDFATRSAARNAARSPADLDAEDFEEEEFADRLIDRLGHALNPPQRSLNRIAAAYLQASTAFQAPLHEYPAITKRLGAENPDFGELKIGGYIARVATAEGWRRAALLAAEMRARRLPPGEVAAAVAASALQDPFRRAPFAWNPQDSTLTFEAPRANGRNRVQTYLY